MNFACFWTPCWPTDEAPAERVAALLDFIPRVAVDARGVIWADVRGLAAPARVAEQLRARLGPGVRAGVAAVPIAAEAAARSTEGAAVVVPPGEERAFLASLPLMVLDPDPGLAALLEGAGVLRCAQLASLPREAVEVRFGAAGAALWRWARADDLRRLFAPVPPEAPHAELDFIDYSVRNAERLLFTVHALLGSVCGSLAARGERARGMVLEFALAGGGSLQLPVRLARPTAERARWTERIRGELERLVLPDAVSGVALRVDGREDAGAEQGDLFDRGFATEGAAEDAVARLWEQLGPVFVAPEPSEHPLPEQRALWTELEPEVAVRGAGGAALLAPTLTLQLLPDPRPIDVATEARGEHDRPVRYRDGDGWRALSEAAGPDRVSGGQDEDVYAREYFRCEAADGRLLWLFRDALGGRWYLHGWWD